MEYILHIDTSGATGFILLAAGGKVLAMRRNEAEREHAGTINGMMDAVLEEAGITFRDLAAVAVCSGPGSYTGLRIGLATAKGICYAYDKPLILQNKLELLPDETYGQPVMVLLPARVGEYFMAVYNIDGTVLLSPQHIEVDALLKLLDNNKEWMILGTAGDDVVNILQNLSQYVNKIEINPYIWSIKAKNMLHDKLFTPIAVAEPLYLKSVFIHHKTT